MKFPLLAYIILLCPVLTACNEDVFIDRPEIEEPPVEKPDPDPEPKPEITDSLHLNSLIYDKSSVTLHEDEYVSEATTIFTNYTQSSGVSILYDNYNYSLVRISNSTYYVIPWAKEQPDVEVPGLDSEGIPGLYGTMIPFAFGVTRIPQQYMPGHIERFDLPPNSKVKATVYTTHRLVTAVANINYYISPYSESLTDGSVNVSVSIPVDIRVEWSEILPAE